MQIIPQINNNINKQSNLKYAKDLNRYFFQRRYTCNQKVYEKILNISKN